MMEFYRMGRRDSSAPTGLCCLEVPTTSQLQQTVNQGYHGPLGDIQDPKHSKSQLLPCGFTTKKNGNKIPTLFIPWPLLKSKTDLLLRSEMIIIQ